MVVVVVVEVVVVVVVVVASAVCDACVYSIRCVCCYIASVDSRDNGAWSGGMHTL